MFDPQHVRNWNRKRTYYTKKGQINQAKAVNVPFTIEPNKIEGYKDYLIKNNLVRPPLQEHSDVIQWDFTKTIGENVADSGIQYEEVLGIRFSYNKITGFDGTNCYGYSALYTTSDNTQIGGVYSLVYPWFLHQYNANSTSRNNVAGSIEIIFRNTDVYFNCTSSENPWNEIGGNLYTNPQNSFVEYSVDEPGIAVPQTPTIFPYNERIADDIEQFVNSHYVFLCKTRNSDLSKNGGWFVFDKDPTFNVLEQFSSVELFYLA